MKMNQVTALWIAMVLLCASTVRASVENEYRTFTAQDGRTIEARIVEYDAGKGKIKIERRGKGMIWIMLGVFCEVDQKYVKEWNAASSFMKVRFFQVTADKERTSKEGTRTKLLKTETWCHDISFRNRSKQSMSGLQVEYKCFVECEGVGSTPSLTRAESGKMELGLLEPNASKTLRTTAVKLETLYRTERERYTSSSGMTKYDVSIVKHAADELVGLWVRVHGPSVGGQPLTRDFMFPDNLDEKVSWSQRGPSFSEVVSTRVLGLSGQEREKWLSSMILKILGAKDAKIMSEMEEISAGLELYHEKTDYANGMISIAVAFQCIGREDLFVKWLLLGNKSSRMSGPTMFDAMLAEAYSSSPNAKVRDGKLAEHYAKKFMNDERRKGFAMAQDLLARAYARQGQFAEAVTSQERALELLTDAYGKHYGKSFRARLERYQRGEPYTRGENDVPLTGVIIMVGDKQVVPLTTKPGAVERYFMRTRVNNQQPDGELK